VLDDKSIDAVVMATPMHWHAAGTILACDAGKDVYVEKPASHNIREGRLMIEAARRNKRIVQVGMQSRRVAGRSPSASSSSCNPANSARC
jgi:predicted dehydrogenase